MLEKQEGQTPQKSSNCINVANLIMMMVGVLVTGLLVGYIVYSVQQPIIDSLDEQVNDLRYQMNVIQAKISGRLNETMSADATNHKTSHIFDLNSIQVGDKYADMTVVAIGKFSDNPNLPPEQPNVKINFSGPTQLDMVYDYIQTSMFSGSDMLCFKPMGQESIEKLPIAKEDQVNAGFCLISGSDEMAAAKIMLGLGDKDESGAATLIIDNYEYVSFPSEVFNTARIISLVE